MVETARRVRSDVDERDSPNSVWEVFVRDDQSGPRRHVGSVVAASGSEAHDRASRLFGWYARDVWLCRAADVVRYAATADDGASDDGGSDDDAGTAEPRVYEETEGTPRVRDAR